LAKTNCMSDDQAFMQLVLANSQGELSPLELGMHVRRYVQGAKGGRGQKGGLSAYAEKMGGNKQRLNQLQHAADVLSDTKNRQINLTVSDLLDKSTHLTAIYDAPREAWPALVQMVVNDGATVAQAKDKAKRLKALFDAIPDWWRQQLDLSSLAETAIASDKTAERRKKAFEVAADLAGSLGQTTIYRHADSGERREVDGREYEVHRAEAVDYNAHSAFVEAVIKRDTAPNADELRRIKRDIDQYIADHGSSSDKLVAVETEEEYRQRLKRETDEARERRRDELRQRVYHGDCRDALADWQGEKIRLLMTDPPYGMAFQSNRRTATSKADKVKGDQSTDEAQSVLQDALSGALPNLANDAHVIVFCHDDSFEHTKSACEAAGLTFKRMLVWVKPNHTSGDLQGSFAPRKELAVHAVKGKPDVSPRRDDVYVQESQAKATDHPTEKPVEVLSYWMECLSDEGDLVADPFAGTGATLVAAAKMGRSWWGAELDDDYHATAVERALEVSDV
jgi:site-specific DNA-methyltransferase (adenine-specific)